MLRHNAITGQYQVKAVTIRYNNRNAMIKNGIRWPATAGVRINPGINRTRTTAPVVERFCSRMKLRLFFLPEATGPLVVVFCFGL